MNLFQFLDKSPSAFHATASAIQMLQDAGYQQLDEASHWQLKPGKGYFVTRNQSSVIAFTPSFRANAREIIAQRQWSTLVASVIVSVTYILVLYSMNFVTNVSYVQVFRQLGLPIGMALGIIVLKEKSAPPKFVGVALILIGLALTVIKF